MENYETVTAALNALRLQGFTIDFNIAFDKNIATEGIVLFEPKDFQITRVYRFEGETDPEDEAVVYGIESFDGALKGVMVSAYGTYADETTNKIIKEITLQPFQNI